jgi:hypothetical protein
MRFRFNINIKLLFLMILSVASISSAIGQGKGFVVGIISDSLNRPIELANITIQGTNVGASSDENGRFRLKVVSNQKITITFSCLGYVPKNIAVNVAEGERKEIDVKLASLSNSIEELSVISSRRKFGNIEKINFRDIGFIPDASGNFESILKSLPGVSSSNELSSQYSVRGGNFDENLIYVNGVEVYRPFLVRSGQQEGLSFVNSDMVSGVEFSSGGFNAEYGDKMSSVLSIEYRKPQGYAANMSVSLLGANVTVEGISKNKKFTHITGFRYKTSKYLLNTLDVKGDYSPAFIDLQSYLSYEVTPKFNLNFLGSYSSNKYQFAPTVRETRFGTFDNPLQLKVYYEGQEVNVFETTLGALSAVFKPNSDIQIKLTGSGFVTYERETYDLLGQYLLNELDNSLGSSTYGDSLINVGIGGSLTHARNFLNAKVLAIDNSNVWKWGINKLKWGVKYQREIIDDQISEWELIDSSGYSLPISSDNLKLSYALKASNTIQSNRVSLFFQDEINFSGNHFNYITSAGARVSYWDYNREYLFSPRVSITMEPKWRNDLSFHISGGVYYQPPFYKELRFIDGNLNPRIKSQKSIHLVLGYEYRFKTWQRPFRFTSELYYKHLSNLIPYKVENVSIRYSGENLAKGYAVGLDIKVNGELLPGAESWASLSLMRTREDISNDSYIGSDGKTIYPGSYPRPTDQLINFGVFFQDYLPNNPTFRVHLSGHYGSGLPVSMPKTDRYDLISRMPSYKRIDIGFSKVFKDDAGKGGTKLNGVKWLKSLWVSAEVFNLLNINNTVSYLWVQTVDNQENKSGMYAVPNYLTSRRINIKLTAKF